MSIDNTIGRKKQLSKINRYSNAANRLNSDAYHEQIAGTYTAKQLREFRFFPCPKSEVFIKAIVGDCSIPCSVFEKEALMTHCNCHPSLTLDQLLDMEFNEVK